MPNYTTPGQLISDLLKERGWTQKALAVVMDRDESTVNKWLAGKGAITVETALVLEEIFKVPADKFLELQRSYDLAVARLSIKPDPNRATRATLFGDLPITDMIKRGWIDAKSIRDTQNIQSGLMRFFKVNSIDDIEIMPHAAKKTKVNEPASPSQLAWLHRVKSIASEMLVSRFTEASANVAIGKLSNLLFSAEEARNVPRILAECGVRFVICETLPSAKIDGVCFWLDERSPVIGMTLRHNRIDNFWFVLRHELEHVRRRHGISSVMLDAELEGDRASESEAIAEEERVANIAAAEFCVPQKLLTAFIRKKAPLFSERDLRGFSRSTRVHPGLIAGQLHHKTGDYSRFRNHLVPIRDIVTPSSVTDGWGDVYPVEKG
ncbi:MAG: helix-turn-helix domain-containing protein [Alphaproteobacteria bacterium]|nr:MAG: helix-turn-helix domain-containing protein [Alphaproteobacteria bacterium]